MKLHDLTAVPGSTKNPKRIGRGHGSGWGKTSGKGQKGQKARAGFSQRAGFEGGQMPLQRRIPKRGFNNIFAKEIVTVNVGTLDKKFEDNAVIDAQALIKAGIIKTAADGVKVLANGNVTKKLNVSVNGYSKSAKEKIEAAGGKAEVI
ncbi:MAG: 50S ribosomal protein L15 [Clostridiales bacterium]|jgi:large subunit ribosomal protein L15|uniref:50S ribosomal protein L15 n=1 Tax=Caproicibacterium sp. BJN0003 TaxID=2994078 RepID=UPI0022551516|nr:50S ribosomal protein L15 [Caproicibacterium sp. BJN0003]MCI1953183.1 50S ribosomal protein L15 [Clostridiales bacterium]MCI2191196.1 50S ribosomal protein L15 [Oscillospiraceae bacterium]MCI1962267.1 50S ribosomal protein L15 [Clostridiales bacterium]MCI2022920.1 50S ribosomal protein L15 [Clostridiales bacterium]MCI2027317.1 50S ribosomal protein L15 [Clostridiales bacterium]